jgi:cytosine/adenosine deaminase-related metal-dependent hydrolase
MNARRDMIANGAIIVNGNIIEAILDEASLRSLRSFDGEIVNVPSLVAIPGFIQTHIHLCQTLFRGLADDLELLDWLKLRIMPYEYAHNAKSIYASAMTGIAELIRSGTTTIMDMGSMNHEEEVIRAVNETGVRAFVGKAMMDVNELYPKLKEPTKAAIDSTYAYARHVHNTSGGRIRYAVAPRFVLSCTDGLLHDAYEMTKDFPGMLFHTHAAENRHEMTAVRERCKMDNIEYFEHLDILHHNTCLAHCIWVNDNELELMKARDAKVLHCPSSNLKLGSGVANIPRYRSNGITVSLGADGAPCNNNLDMFKEMHHAALIQKPIHGPTAMNAKHVFEMATRGGAATLGIAKEVGSLEAGKKADIVLLDLTRVWNSTLPTNDDELYSSVVYSGSPENVHSVMIDGRWVFRHREHVSVDEAAVACAARKELRTLLTRVSH